MCLNENLCGGLSEHLWSPSHSDMDNLSNQFSGGELSLVKFVFKFGRSGN